ncbi:uncharacterized protein LOC123889448 isoform X2 [Trifolium pratense]|uniref:uncharacterized protein LOC123889448 isoform X2 n=1 Tax=Trifolium pratense TaxID=57577 RepID=UPI001E693CCA|nr:uncharacterized protein LOC123889448 isoform X2 [Trifolium pratense]
MGRRPKLKNNDKPENAIPSTEISEQQDVNGNINPTKVLDSQLENAIPSTEISEQQGVNGNINPTKVLDSQLENAHSVCSPQKHPNSSVAEVESAQEQTKQVGGNAALYEASSIAPISYRSMYIDSQKKLEALANENQLLNEQLENALSKVEMYEKENRALNELYDRLKDTVQQQLSNVAKSTEAATQEIDTAYSASAAKRKRIEG